MLLDEVMSELESMGTAQNRKVYPRHGARFPMFGVSFANLGKLQKRIRRDHELAEQLWETGNHDAQMLACRIAAPASITVRRVHAPRRVPGGESPLEEGQGIRDSVDRAVAVRIPALVRSSDGVVDEVAR